MAGNYTEGVSKVLSGVYTLIKAALQRVTLGDRGVVAYPFVSDWGPVNKIVEIGSNTEFDKTFNGSKTTYSGKYIYQLAFKANPNKVKAYRMATAAAAAATTTLVAQDSVTSLKLDTVYPTTRAFTATVRDGFTAGEKIIDLLEGSNLITSVSGSTVADLVAKLNATGYVKVTQQGTAVPKNVSAQAFSGGNNGESVTATEYTNFLAALETESGVNAFSLDGVTDDAIIESARAWTVRVRSEGLYLTFVNGGPSSWDTTPADGNTKSLAFNFRGVVNVGIGVDGYTPAQAAIFAAARVAAVGLNNSVTDEVTPFTSVNKKLTRSERIAAKKAGTLVFVQENGQVLIDEGVNTLTIPGVGESAEMGKIRVNNTLDQIAADLENFGDQYKRGRSNTEEARQAFAATVETDYFAGLANLDVIKSTYSYDPDPDYHGDKAVFNSGIDEAYFYSVVWPIDSMEKIYQKVNVNF